jgi:hypothetical protein
MRVEADHTPSSGSGLLFRHTGTNSLIQSRNEDGFNWVDLDVQGSDVRLIAKSGLIDASVSAADLRLATGQAIEDGSGTKRLNLLSSETTLKDDSGDSLLSVGSGFGQFFRVYSGQEFVISDEVLDAGAVKYKPDSTTGTFELTNAVLNPVHGIKDGPSTIDLINEFLADGEIVSLNGKIGGSILGFLYVQKGSSGARYGLTGGSNSTTLLEQFGEGGNEYGDSQADSDINVYHDGSNYVIENNDNTGRSMKIQFLGTA